MIDIKIYRDQNNIIGFEIGGHASYAEYGQDIVCAAVSVLGQTCLMALVDVCQIEEDRIDYSIDDEIGFLQVNLPKKLSIIEIEKSQIVLKTFELGIKSIIESYPNNVTLINREV